MPITQASGKQLLDGSVQRSDQDVTTPGQAVILKVLAGNNIAIGAFTGADSGTGDVTLKTTDVLTLTSQTVASVSTPSAGTNALFFDSASNQIVIKTNDGRILGIDPSYVDNETFAWVPPPNSTVPVFLGCNTFPVLGTATARAKATTNAATRVNRMGLVSAATAGSLAAIYRSSQDIALTLGGGSSGKDGFLLKFKFVVSDPATVAGARMWIGIKNVLGAPSNAEPSTLTNGIGIGQLSTSNNLQIIYGGSAAQTPIDLGANFPANTLSADAYYVAFYAPSNSNNTVYYFVKRIGTAFTASGTLTGTAGTVLPANTLMMSFTGWRCNNATALAVGLDMGSIIGYAP